MKLDRNFFKMGSHLESGDNRNFWKDKTIIERLEASFYLNSISYNFDIKNPPKMDKTLFSHRKHL
ncbi:hypothetical protein ABID42_003786 [Arcicella rosea]